MAVGYLLDTNIVSSLLDGYDTVLIERIAVVDERDLFVSAITYYELWFGLTRRLMQTPSSKRLVAIWSRLQQWSKDALIDWLLHGSRLQPNGFGFSRFWLPAVTHFGFFLPRTHTEIS